MSKISMVLAVATLVSMTSTARAGGVLVTAPASASYPTAQTLYCDALNAGTKPLTITFEAVQYDGTVDASQVDTILAPGQGDALLAAGGSAYCRFTVTKGSSKKVRAAALYDDGAGYTVAIPAQ